MKRITFLVIIYGLFLNFTVAQNTNNPATTSIGTKTTDYPHNTEAIAALKVFFKQPSAIPGQNNGARLGIPDIDNWDPKTHEAGISWVSSASKLEIWTITWESRGLSGSLDLSNSKSLWQLRCPGNELKELKASSCNNMKIVKCERNKLTALNVSDCKVLESLDCSGNLLTAIDLSSLPAFISLSCYENKLTHLDVSSCSNLLGLNCGRQNLKSLNVSGCKKLRTLYCADNLLTELDLSSCSAIEELSCCNNLLQKLDVSSCLAINLLWGFENPILFSGLPKFNSVPVYRTYIYAPQKPVDGGSLKYDSTLDLSSEYSISREDSTEKVTNFHWYEYGDNNKRELTGIVNNKGKFTFPKGYIGKKLSCDMTNANFPDQYWSFKNQPSVITYHIQLVDNSSTGIDHAAASPITIYPNPVKDILNVKHPESKILQLSIIDMNGREIQMAHPNSMDYQLSIGNLPNGIYIVKTTTESGTTINKIVKE